MSSSDPLVSLADKHKCNYIDCVAGLGTYPASEISQDHPEGLNLFTPEWGRRMFSFPT